MNTMGSNEILKEIWGVANDCTSCYYAEGTYLSIEPVQEKWWCKKHNVPATDVCVDYVPDPEFGELWGDDPPTKADT